MSRCLRCGQEIQTSGHWCVENYTRPNTQPVSDYYTIIPDYSAFLLELKRIADTLEKILEKINGN